MHLIADAAQALDDGAHHVIGRAVQRERQQLKP